MYNSDTELIFPLRIISTLKTLRGEPWAQLIGHLNSQDVIFSEQLAFVLMMVRLGGCVNCNADSFRAMKGCSQCARHTVRRFRGADQELINQYRAAQMEVEKYLDKHPRLE